MLPSLQGTFPLLFWRLGLTVTLIITTTDPKHNQPYAHTRNYWLRLLSLQYFWFSSKCKGGTVCDWMRNVSYKRVNTTCHTQWDLLHYMQNSTQLLTAWLSSLGFILVVLLHFFSPSYLFPLFSSSISFIQSFEPKKDSAHLVPFSLEIAKS